MKNKMKIYHTLGTIPKSNIKIVERNKIQTPKTQMHDNSLSWLVTTHIQNCVCIFTIVFDFVAFSINVFTMWIIF